MATYTVVMVKMMSQVVNVEADDIKTAVAEALGQEAISPGAGDPYDAAGDTEVQCVDKDGVTVWESGNDDESEIYAS